MINIHPSLIPSFCGKGFYGSKVHKAVLAMGAKSPAARSISPTTPTITAPSSRSALCRCWKTTRSTRSRPASSRKSAKHCPRPSRSMQRAVSGWKAGAFESHRECELQPSQMDSVVHKSNWPSPPSPIGSRLRERLGVAYTGQLAPVSCPVANCLDHAGPALGLVIHQLRAVAPQCRRPWRRAGRRYPRPRWAVRQSAGAH